MSSAYISEPPTKGKVVMKTTLGDLEVELWPKEAPKAVRNFVQLCMEGYYDGTIFHRVVKSFIVQGGDPTGTGTGGESIYGEPFQDEFHSRLRFSHRGLLAMANTGRHTNTSQFFFTLDKTDELNRKNTIFGKIVGDTIYNLLALGEVEAADDERPLFPPKIISIDILSNPFDDIEPRTTAQERAEKAAREKAERERLIESAKPKAIKNRNLLSFDDDAEEPVLKGARMKSSHDLLKDERLSKDAAVTAEDMDGGSKKKSKKRRREKEDGDGEQDEDDDDDDGDDDSHRLKAKAEALSAAKRKYEKAKEEVDQKGNRKKAAVRSEIEKLQDEIRSMSSARKTKEVEKEAKDKTASVLKEFREQYKSKATMGRRRKNENAEELLDRVEQFKNKLFRDSDNQVVKAPTTSWTCELHGMENCKSCKTSFGEEGIEDDAGWMSHELHFAREAVNVFEPSIDDYVVFDPREDGKQGGDRVTTRKKRL